MNGSQNITLISYGHFEQEFLVKIARSIEQEFRHTVNIVEGHIDLSEFYEPGRRQYDGTRLLRVVDSMSSPESVKTMGLFSVDLFIPILTYIFGQAYLNGSTGIASIYRLRNELYGMRSDRDILHERFTKVCIHELGHAFGLTHCYSPNCVMKSSTYVEDIDLKRYNLCAECRKETGMV